MTRPQEEPDSGLLLIGEVSSWLALVALLIGGTLLSFLTRPTLAATVDLVHTMPAFVLAGGLALACISLFDLGTVPALHHSLRDGRPALVYCAVGTALIGDILGICGRLVQASIGTLGSAATGTDVRVLTAVEATINSAGFVLVAVAFGCFGVAFWLASQRALGVTGVVTGLATGFGQIPGLTPLFWSANLGFLAWYVGLALLFRRTRRRV